ncbi:methenyltetrahydromethanopterin cyclohydrolase [Calycomorphotria hydatis]|uniref:Methenyltetrahydromethanopterin cyclohydrolase n=1 Tax=Calycomorphotria hydatis TaxID=2528027 RepID=A0A517TAP3_9PLAN|nr:methenyltetrahydromethanopterin cyclohydrolase [Calycomorphotria hydatis]QDT65443.1 Methenyltetrahydromethanopterin cyclohydrolase [Calycomorphotria hydatis]
MPLPTLNDSATAVVENCRRRADELRVVRSIVNGAEVLDFGQQATGGLSAGVELARICMAGLGDIQLVPGNAPFSALPQVSVRTDFPFESCLLSQYAGWKIQTEKFFGMGSGPLRAVSCVEDLFAEFDYREQPQHGVLVLESSSSIDDEVVNLLSEKSGLSPEQLTICIAPTASLAGTLQVVARSVETCLHKLHELKFDVRQIRSGMGVAPLPPVAKDDLSGIGLTNDAILYGGHVTLWVTAEDDQLAEIGPQVPSSASDMHGSPFLELFKAANYDFYEIDPHLFSPATVQFINLSSGRVFQFGEVAPAVLEKSFSMSF